MANKLKIQAFSDIHIELWNILPELPVLSKYLFLAGDVCFQNHPLFYKFFDYCSSNWEKVFYTPGNHEFYIKKKNYNELSFEYKHRLQERYKNIYYLDNECVALNDEIDVYGTTFWTNPPFSSTSQAKQYINDYNFINYFREDNRSVVDLDITYVKKLSGISFNGLKMHLENTKKQTIVMTHFPPLRTGTSSPKYKNQDPIIANYFSWPDSTLDLFKITNVPLWISGHTHWSYDFEKDGVRFVSNQVGYKSEINQTKLNEEGVYEIEIIS